jgi:hypothetical protein
LKVCSCFVAFEAGNAVPDQSVVFAEEVKALIRCIADAQIVNGHFASAKEVFGKSDTFITAGELFKIPMDDQ